MSSQPKIFLIQHAPEGEQQIEITAGELKIGRGETMDVRAAGSGLSRHHASIFLENGCIWILDNNSTNGSFVNSVPVAPSGTSLINGDKIRLGNDADFTVKIIYEKKLANQPTAIAASPQNSNLTKYVALAVVLIAVTIIGLALAIVAARSTSRAAADEPPLVAQTDDDNSEIDDESLIEKTNKNSSSNKQPRGQTDSNSSNSNAAIKSEKTELSTLSTTNAPRQTVLPSKTYLEMSDAEKREFIQAESIVVARMIGNRSGAAAPPAAVERIKSFVEGYARRLKTAKRFGTCGFSDNLETVVERASQNAQFIVPAFNSEGLAPQLGLYLAMIESEHCVCLQSPTGPLGMFQFTRATGAGFGLTVKQNGSPENPDERCEPEKAAPAAARYMKFLAGRYGTGALSVPLAIASYNSGQGGLSSNLQTALAEESNQERSFWTLVANEGKLSAQFQKENIKYVPKFFAAAIVGENPTIFGVKKPPISSNTK